MLASTQLNRLLMFRATSKLVNASESLRDYNSEYHYIFSRLHSYRDKSELSYEDALLTANLSRKLLEAFFSFKYPKSRNSFADLLTSGLRGCKGTDDVEKERIYRFINRYSHSDLIETNEDLSENLLGESQDVIGTIFSWIKEVDKTHYEEMVKVVEPS